MFVLPRGIADARLAVQRASNDWEWEAMNGAQGIFLDPPSGFSLDVKGPQDDEMWTPNMSAIRATICFINSTKRFEKEENA